MNSILAIVIAYSAKYHSVTRWIPCRSTEYFSPYQEKHVIVEGMIVSLHVSGEVFRDDRKLRGVAHP